MLFHTKYIGNAQIRKCSCFVYKNVPLILPCIFAPNALLMYMNILSILNTLATLSIWKKKRISGTYFSRFVASILSTLNECCMQYSFVIFIFCSNYGSVVYINNNSDQFRWNVVEFQPWSLYHLVLPIFFHILIVFFCDKLVFAW